MALDTGPEVGHAFVSIIPSLRGASGRIKSELNGAHLGDYVGREMSSGATRAGSRAGGLFSRAFNRQSSKAVNFPGPSASLLRNIRTYGFVVTGAIGLTAGLGLKTASSLEQAQVAFTTMLGSAKEARTFLGSLVQFAKATPFDFPGVVTASQQLLAFGFSAQQVLPTLTALGDASAGLSLGADGLQRLTVAVGQIQAKGRVQSDELLQLTEAGVPALRILANQFGTTTANIQALVTKGLVPADKAIPALLRGLEQGTNGLAGPTAKFGGLMAKQSKTLGGIFSNLKDSISLGLAQAIRPLIPVLKREMPRAAAALGGVFRRVATDLGEFLHGLGLARDRSRGVTTGFEQFGSVLRTAGRVIRAVFGFISDHAAVFKPLGAALLGAAVGAKLFAAGMVLVNFALDANPIGLIIVAIGALVGGLIYAYKRSETFRNIVNAVFRDVARVAGVYVSLVVRYFKFLADVWITVVGSIVQAAATAFGWVPFVGPKLKTAANAFDSFKTHIDAVLGGIATDAAGWGAATGQNFAAGVAAAPGMKRLGFDGPGFSSGFDTPGAGSFSGPGAWDKSRRHVTNTVVPAFNAAGLDAGKAVAAGLDKSSTKAGQSAQELADKILAPLRALRDKAKQLAQSITEGILGATGFGALGDATDSLGASMGRSVKSIVGSFVQQQREVAKFRRELRILQRRGLSTANLNDLASQGAVEGGSIAQSLLGATRGQLRQINRATRGTRRDAQAIGVGRARDTFGGQIAYELRRTQRAIEKASHNTDLTDRTIRKLEHMERRVQRNTKVYLNTDGLDRREGRKVLAS